MEKNSPHPFRKKVLDTIICSLWILMILLGNSWHASAQINLAQPMYKVAAAQLSPVFLDKEKSLEKALNAIDEASVNKADLIVFPEVFLAGYPIWTGYLSPGIDFEESNKLYVELLKNAIMIPGPETARLCSAAKEAKVNVVIGVHELNIDRGGTIFNTIIFISDEGELLGKHRKLVPTGPEKLVWGRGEANTFQAFDTSVGRIGGLICWENRMPLARTALYQMGIQILVSPTAARGDNWLAAMKNAAWEGGVYVINVCAPAHKDWIPDIYDDYKFKKIKSENDQRMGIGDWPVIGGSCIIAPDGEILAGPLNAQEGIIYANIDLNSTMRVKQIFDAVGNYSRPDVFDLSFTK